MKYVLIAFAMLSMSACDTPEQIAARREVFNECMDKADKVKESNFALFNKGDDLIAACEGYARRNS
jgi:hypothetical protein